MNLSPLVRWLLERRLDRVTAEAVIGDLTEGFHQRARGGLALGARWWVWRQALLSIAAARPPRRNPASGSPTRRGAGWIDAARRDTGFALRSLRRSPAFAIAAIGTLAIGIGASTAIGTAATRALFRPLPYPHGDRLVFLGHPNDNGTVGNVGFATVVDWRARLSTFDDLAIIRGWAPTLVAADGASPVPGMKVSWNYFRMLGVRPALGRDFSADDDTPDRWRVVLLSDRLWRRQFQARPEIVGATVSFNSRDFQVIGVLPPSFEPLGSDQFYRNAEIWSPLGYSLTGDSACRSCQHLRLIGRLGTSATLSQARLELATVHAGLRREHPSDYSERPPVAVMLRDEIARPIRRPLQILLGAVLFVLLVSSANVAGLLMARAADREREFALRAALGAGWGRLVRQSLTESLVLAGVAGGVGLLLAEWSLTWLARYAPITMPRIDSATTDPAFVVLALVTSLAALVAFGLLPALLSTRVGLEGVLRASRQTGTRRTMGAREWLMAGQVAIALLLVAGAGLMHRTVDRLLQVDPGFNPQNVLSLGLSLVGPAWAEDAAVRAFQTELLQRVRALPGVDLAALTGQVPLGGNYNRWGIHVEGQTYATEADAPSVERYSVTPEYFDVMRIPLKQGRFLTEADRQDSAPVMLVSETAARELWTDGRPLGRRVRMGGTNGTFRTVVGIVGDVRHYTLGEAPTPQFYLAQQQTTDSYLMLVVRTAASPDALVPAIRRTVTGLARDVPVYDVATLDARLDRSLASRTFLMFLLGLFALTTLVIAAIGLYGVASQSVAARRRELGIRVALGAARADITWLVVRRGLTFVAIGIVSGLVACAFVGRLLGGLLYETTPADPGALAAAAALLFGVALLAHITPLRRALGVDPAVTLRNE